VTDERLSAIEDRIEKLEAGRFDLLTLSTGVHIVDGEGRLRLAARLVEGEPAIKLWSSDGRSGIFLGGGADAAEINFSDASDRIRLKLMLGADSGPTLVLLDEAGVMRLTASVTDGVPRVMLYDEAETIRLALDVDEEGAIELSDRAERPRIGLRTNGLAEPLVCTIDGEGNLTGRL
jgi:hypothetical protein